ncbi:hypothetical protein KSP39_PZI018471 [Platanthera zijinensis]|uniref:Integrase catalytic domain-containing protein n=1 Tax=Platanthera zijinensis TaxID=2320716 RepID=A0AAP0B3U3_9ASPA
MSREFTKYCNENGVVRELTVRGNPQQNGVVERKKRTILEMTRCMMNVKNILHCYWGEAANTAVYLLNRAPTRTLSNSTPYELWYNLKPNRVGCGKLAGTPRRGEVRGGGQQGRLETRVSSPCPLAPSRGETGRPGGLLPREASSPGEAAGQAGSRPARPARWARPPVRRALAPRGQLAGRGRRPGGLSPREASAPGKAAGQARPAGQALAHAASPPRAWVSREAGGVCAKIEPNDEINHMEKVLEKDLKSAASLFTLTNCNTR